MRRKLIQKNTWLTTPEIKELVKELRKLIHEAVSEFVEVVRWGNLSYQTRKKRYVCTMSPHNAHVNIHFWHGKELRDPQILIQCLGKKLRNIR
jgi:hypothetical protein